MSVRIEAVKLELLKAETLMTEADIIINNEAYHSTVHVLYYACFHATKALLLTKDLVVKTHRGVSNLLFQHFVIPGSFDEQQAAFYSELMSQRQESDYGEELITEDEVLPFVQPAKSYFSYVTKMVKDYVAE